MDEILCRFKIFSPGRFSLSLDISEVFKPVIVFRTIFDLVNNHKLQIEKHFEKNVNYCILNEEGRKIFITLPEICIQRGYNIAGTTAIICYSACKTCIKRVKRRAWLRYNDGNNSVGSVRLSVSKLLGCYQIIIS